MRTIGWTGLAAILVLAPGVSSADEASGTLGLITDLHLNPFDPPELAAQLSANQIAEWPAIFATVGGQKMASWGSDSNYALLASSVKAFAQTVAGADFVIVSGDLLAHEFEAKAASALNVAATDQTVDDMAVKTTAFVADQIGDALPGKPIILALGNNDSECGDYEIKPDGNYLAATADTVRQLAGKDLVASDFDETYKAGGYFAVRHPQHVGTQILVINDILWSAKYKDACGSGGDGIATAMMDWLAANLARQREAGGWIWIIHHIPWGIDSFSTVHSKESACADKVVPFLHEDYEEEYIAPDARISGHHSGELCRTRPHG